MTTPRKDYHGGVPKWLVDGWKIASGNSQEDGVLAAQWKCSSGRVLACATPMGEDWCGKPDQIEEPTQEMVEYCTNSRKGAIPRLVTGNTMPVWICKRRKPRISGYHTELDAEGYLSGTWIDVTALAPSNMAGAVRRSYLSRWKLPVKVGLIGSMRKSGALVIGGRTDQLITTFAVMEIKGGSIGSAIGRTIYYGENARRQVGTTGCIANLVLSAATLNSITVVEQYLPGKSRCRRPETFMLQESQGQMRVNWMRKGRSKPKRSLWIQAFRAN